MLKALDGLTWVSRVLVGALFVVSGLIKSNDALGFMYKLEEYFEPGAMNLEFLGPWALELAVFVCIAEILLGIAILVGALPKLTSVLTTVMMVFFTWLTWYTATCDPFGTKEIVDASGAVVEIANQCVLECGCFGNAIPLTAYQSFLKDLVLLIFVVPIVFSAFLGRIQLNTPRQGTAVYSAAMVVTYLFGEMMLDWNFPVLYLALNLIAAEAVKRRWNHAQKEWGMALAVVAVSGFVQFWTLSHLPLKDYRPYAVGENVLENRMTAEELGLEGPEFDKEIRFYHPETGAEKLVMQSEYMAQKLWDKANEPGTSFMATYPEGDWEHAREVKVKDGYEQRILDFQMVDAEGNDLTDTILGADVPVLLHISKDLDAMSTSWQDEFNALGAAAQAEGWAMYGLTNATAEEHAAFVQAEGATYPFLTCDQTELKIVVRANPGLVWIQQGVVMEKWAGRDVPSVEELTARIEQGR
jgi:uncharacterized membrane protein YphA (DoxX/SURF4 family)